MNSEKQSTHVEWRERTTFDATTTTGHRLVLDTLPPNGNDRGPKPVELLLTALAGCTAMDVLALLKEMREPVIELSVDVEGTRADTHPMIYTDIDVMYHVRGDVGPASLDRAIELSQGKYSGVYAMLEYSAHITTRYEIDSGQATEPAIVYGPDHSVELEHVAGSLP